MSRVSKILSGIHIIQADLFPAVRRPGRDLDILKQHMIGVADPQPAGIHVPMRVAFGVFRQEFVKSGGEMQNLLIVPVGDPVILYPDIGNGFADRFPGFRDIRITCQNGREFRVRRLYITDADGRYGASPVRSIRILRIRKSHTYRHPSHTFSSPVKYPCSAQTE